MTCSRPNEIKLLLSEEMYGELQKAAVACGCEINAFAIECVESVLASRRLADPQIANAEAYWKSRSHRHNAGVLPVAAKGI